MPDLSRRPWLALYQGVPSTIEPAVETALDMFRATLARGGPDAVLARYFDQAVTAGDIDAMSDALAVDLQRRGIEPGDRVAMYLQNIPQVLITVLAAWKCGAVIVPCNPMLRERELAKILSDSGSRVIICQEDLFAEVARTTLPSPRCSTPSPPRRSTSCPTARRCRPCSPASRARASRKCRICSISSAATAAWPRPRWR
jgi:long-chain acyl-CoA synthetase